MKFFRLAGVLLILVLSASPATSQPASKIAILPFAIHSLESLGPLKEGMLDMLASRIHADGRIEVIDNEKVRKAASGIKGEINQGAAQEVGRQLGADYVLFGSVTKIGDNFSLDAKLVEMKSGRVASTVSAQSRGLNEVVPQVVALAQKVQEKILGHPLHVASPPSPKEPSSATPPPPVRRQEVPVVVTPAPVVRQEVPAAAKPPKTVLSQTPQDIWMSEPLLFEVKGMAVGDVDGDGRNEIVLIDQNNVRVYRWEGELRLIHKIEGRSYHEYIMVDAGDINKNGKAEIFVTSIRKERLESFVLEYDRGGFRKIAADVEWHFRILDLPQQGPTLVGQQSSLEYPFYGSLYEMSWNGKGYARGKKLPLPKGMNIYGLAVVQFDGGPVSYLYIDHGQYLTLVSQEGKVLWESNERYGTNNFIMGKPKMTTSFVEESDWIPVNLKILSAVRDGRKEIILPHNSSVTGEYIKRVKLYNRGEVQRLSWNGTIMDLSWHSKEVPGYIADCAFQDVDGDGKKELVAAVVLWGRRDIKSKKSAVVVFKQ